MRPGAHDESTSQTPAQGIEATPAHNLDPAILTTISLVYEDLVEVEALAVTADEAVTNLPPKPRGKYGRTLARLYTAP